MTQILNSEADVIHKKIDPFLQKLNYDGNNIEYEKSISIGRNQTVYADIVINIDECTALVIEAKKLGENLKFYEKQAISYGLLLRATYTALTDGDNLLVFSVQNGNLKYSGKLDHLSVKFLDKKNLSSKIEKNIIENDNQQQIEEAKKILLIFEDIKKFSEILYDCQDIIRDNDGLTGSDAFDEIAKILFIKIFYEKQEMHGGENEIKTSSLSKKPKLGEYFNNHLFKQVKDANKDIFSDNEIIRLQDLTLSKLIAKLENYTLLNTNVDVKGRTFEIFLGRTFTGSLGQYFTPRTIVSFMTEFYSNYLKMFTKDKMCKIIDPSCGSGGFLIEIFRYLYLANINDPTYIEALRKKAIYGVDLDPRLAKVAKMNMLLHGDGYSGIWQGNGLTSIKKDNEYDLVISNPPFGNKDSDTKILSLFDLGKHVLGSDIKNEKNKDQLREILFVEKCIKIAKWGGRIAIVLPDGILNNKKLNYVRNYIREHTIIEAVVSLPDRTFKAGGANSKCSILFLKKKIKESDITPPIFMALAENIGFETKTKKAKEISSNDFYSIASIHKENVNLAIEYFNNSKNNIWKLSDSPSCFFISSELMKDRIDACYFYAKYVYSLEREGQPLYKVANLVKDKMDLSKYPYDEFNYVQFSNIDTKSGSITSFEVVTGQNAPDRAKQVVKSGDIICATVKDSEENIAIVPTGENIIVSTGFAVFRAIAPMTSEALYALLRQRNNLLQVRYKSSGTIMPSIGPEEYLENILPKLSLPEIKSVTEKLKIMEQQRNEIRNKLSDMINNL